MQNTKLPAAFKKYFWDVDFNKLDKNKSDIYITERLLEFGDIKVIRWLIKTYGKNLIKKVVMTKTGISPKTGNFWGDMLNVPKSQIPSLKNGLPNSTSDIWDYRIQ